MGSRWIDALNGGVPTFTSSAAILLRPSYCPICGPAPSLTNESGYSARS